MKIKTLGKAIALGLSAALMSMALLACSGAQSQSPEELIRTDLINQLDPIKDLSPETLAEISDETDMDEFSEYGVDGEELMKSYLDGFDYRIDNIEVDGDTAVAEVTLTLKSYSGFSELIYEKAQNLANDSASLAGLSADQQKEKIGEIVMAAINETPVVETDTIEITYEKEGSTWTPTASAGQAITRAMMTN